MRRVLVSLCVIVAVLGSSGFSVPLAAAPPLAVPTPHPTVSLSPTPTPTNELVSPQPTTAQHVVTRTVATPRPVVNNLSLPSLGFQAPIVTVGVTADNAIDVPAGLQIGWWNGSARPGTSGAVFLDGHVDGVFKRLPNAVIGQTASVYYDGQTYTYQIVHKEVVDLTGVDMTRTLSVYGGGAEGLNMMTCAGNYDPARGTYDQRLVVYAVRV